MRRLLIPLLLCALSAPTLAAEPGAAKRIAAAQRAVADALKDPDSAKFRKVRVSASDYVCGEVNAKNSNGGYAGFVPFVVTADGEARMLGVSEAVDIVTNLTLQLHCGG